LKNALSLRVTFDQGSDFEGCFEHGMFLLVRT